MKVRIIKGTNQIGGCITEITSDKGTKIIIDFGEDLIEEKTPIEIEGLTTGKSIYDAVFITHSHIDHIGLVNDINEDIPVFVEKETRKIHNLSSDFMKDAKIVTRQTNIVTFEDPVNIHDLKITAYIADHSAYNSCMYLIEDGEKKILHTGDYRNHGRKGRSLLKTLKQIGKVELLITEGTTFGRSNEKFKTEEELLREAYPIFETYNQIFILQSSTNLDRLVTFYKASNHTKKYFIEDLFTATITSHLKKTIPSPMTHPNVSVWISSKYYKKSQSFKETYIKPMELYQKNPFHHDFCMMVKLSMLQDIKEKLYEKGLLKNACIIYSMWEGYLKEEKMKHFIEELQKMGVTFFKLHTSGHADIKAMRQVEKILKPKKTILIHTERKEMAKKLFQTVVDLEDGREFRL